MSASPSPQRDALFERLFAEWQQSILNYLYRMTGDADRAEDMTQEVFVRAYRGLEKLPPDANHRAWLYRIATNLSRDQHRRRRLVQWLPLRETDPAPLASNPAEGAGAGDAVRRALAQVPPEGRTVLILYAMQGYSTTEIAEMLSLSVDAVKKRLARARERFRRAYGADE
jgi:RNA polymerase sigma-70 factor (ECF subfamily)